MLKIFSSGTQIFFSESKWLHPIFEFESFLATYEGPRDNLSAYDTAIGKAAAVLLIAGGMVVANANKGPYEQEETVKIIFNGEEKDAYFHDWNEDTVSWRFEVDDKEAWIYVTHTEPVDKNTTMYVTYNGEYIIASDEPEPTLNLYTDIDRSFAVIEEDSYSGQTSLIMTTDCGRQSMTLAADEEDGTKDGIINLGADTYEVYTVLSDGSIAQTSIHDHSSGMSERLEYFAEKSVDNYTAADEENDNPYTIDDMPPTAE